jgi:hypothetical protein
MDPQEMLYVKKCPGLKAEVRRVKKERDIIKNADLCCGGSEMKYRSISDQRRRANLGLVCKRLKATRDLTHNFLFPLTFSTGILISKNCTG